MDNSLLGYALTIYQNSYYLSICCVDLLALRLIIEIFENYLGTPSPNNLSSAE